MSLIFSIDAMPGDLIDQTCVDMQVLADKINVVVRADFNGVKLYAKPGGSAAKLLANWKAAFSSKSDFKTAWSHL